jgi:hypothetical protein
MVVESIAIPRRNVALQLTILKRHAHAIAGDDGGRAADDHRPIRIPADRITAREYRERAEVAEPSGERRQVRLGAMPRSIGRCTQTAAHVSQPRPHR